MLYLFTTNLNGVNQVIVSSKNPDTEDYEDVLSNSFVATLSGGKAIPADIAINVVRNVLVEGGCKCQMM
jgi:hypothetical protein